MRALLNDRCRQCLAFTVQLGVLSGCGQSGETVVQGKEAYFYATAHDCHRSSRGGPGENNNRTPQGIVAHVPPGRRLQVVDDDIGKDSLCLEVLFDGGRGYVFVNPGHVDLPPGRRF